MLVVERDETPIHSELLFGLGFWNPRLEDPLRPTQVQDLSEGCIFFITRTDAQKKLGKEQVKMIPMFPVFVGHLVLVLHRHVRFGGYIMENN